MNNIEKAWLACAIDSEGSVTIEKSTKNGYPVVLIYNTNINFLQYANKIIGRDKNQYTKVTITNAKYQFHMQNATKRTEYKPCYKIKINGKKAQELLKKIFPYLIIKKDKALKAIMIKTKTRSEHIKYLNKKITPQMPRDLFGRFLSVNPTKQRLELKLQNRNRDEIGRFTI